MLRRLAELQAAAGRDRSPPWAAGRRRAQVPDPAQRRQLGNEQRSPAACVVERDWRRRAPAGRGAGPLSTYGRMLGGADGDGEIRLSLAARAAENGLLATAAACSTRREPARRRPEPRRGEPRAGRGQGRGGRRCRRARPARRPGGRQGFVAAGPGRPARSAAGRGRLPGRRRPRRGRGAGRRPGSRCRAAALGGAAAAAGLGGAGPLGGGAAAGRLRYQPARAPGHGSRDLAGPGPASSSVSPTPPPRWRKAWRAGPAPARRAPCCG